MAKVYYAKHIYLTAFGVATRQHNVEGVQGMGLMKILPYIMEPMISQAMVDHTVIPEIYLRLYCAVSHHNSGEMERAVEHVDRAIALALPDRLYGILAVHWRLLDTLLEKRLALADPEAVRHVKELQRRFSSGQETISNHLRQRAKAINLSDRERQVAKLAAFGKTNRRIAEQLGVGESTVKTIVQKIMQKTGLTDRSDFVQIL